ncbi:hypothetical protein H2200_013169 [Cladophialophora chaetospira]|uniref:Autophagy-related protein 1 n=1 Tax=Cladophialophora chaetospira TaxID=386627 RepID=A0AA39CBG9_9EURO|nr:hypothetical protein H2200_013169 [Cladophialophora chaetospira]
MTTLCRLNTCRDAKRGMRKVRVEKRWIRQRHIGHGAFGEVWLEVYREQEQVVAERAVKGIQKRRMENLNIDYKRELLALAKLSRHQDLFVSLHGWYEDDDSVFLAMEYLQHGDLGNFINGGITENGARMICAQLLDGLSTMHSLGFTHRDLKPQVYLVLVPKCDGSITFLTVPNQNIFVVSAAPWWIKIGDFGTSKRIASEQTALRTQAGTRQFQAPEILGYVEEAEETSEYTNLVDIWSLGCVTHLILADTAPFANARALIDYSSGRIEFPYEALQDGGISVDGRHFVVALLNPRPSKRPTAQIALQHIWLQASPSTQAPQPKKSSKIKSTSAISPSKSQQEQLIKAPRNPEGPLAYRKPDNYFQ